jgi:hypothetical protein
MASEKVLSLDDEEVETKKINMFKLNDCEFTVESKYFKDNIMLNNLSFDEKDQNKKFVLKVDLFLNDFLIFIQYFTGKKIIRGDIQDFDKFSKFCDYIGEIELPILVTKNSDMIIKWFLTKNDLINAEKENFLLDIYLKLDEEKEEKEEKEEILKKYTLNEFNNKLNQKTGFMLFKEIEKVDIGSLIFPLGEIVPNPEVYAPYPILKSRHTFLNTDRSDAIVYLSKIFTDFPWKSEKGGSFFLAGGSVLKSLAIRKDYFYSSDFDFFLITRDSKEAEEMIENFYLWIKLSYCKDKEFYMIRTNNSISILTKNNIVFQIILRLYHTSEQVLCGFDLDPCCFGFDGDVIYTIPRGLLSLERKSFQVTSWRQSKTMGYRTRKYFDRGFSIICPGLTVDEMLNCDKEGKGILSKILKLKSKKDSDYSEIVTYRNFNFTIYKIRNNIRFSTSPDLHVITKDLKIILDMNSPDDEFTLKNRNCKDPKIKFIKKMCHGQNSGSFQPTSCEWFKDFKW